MKLILVVVGGTFEHPEVELTLPVLVGRGAQAQLSIPHRLVSRRHCELRWRDYQLVVQDLGSLNGTYVGDQRVTEAVVESGALLTVGSITFRAVYERPRREDEPSPSHQSERPTLGGETSQPTETETLAWDGVTPADDRPTNS